MEIEKSYDSAKYERDIYARWENSKVFTADATSDAEKYTIMMPPPNATGQLHLGHATMLAIEDILIRYKRMKGKSTLWLPGTDHAAIATQSVVEKKLQGEGIKNPRVELGREKLLEEIQNFVDASKVNIKNQTKRMGSSCDWSRERYTMEPAMNLAVNTCFQYMYDDGLIYRGYRLVNWDPKMKTTVADDELEYVDETTPLYYLQYGPFVMVTARPETKFGQQIVVVHPDDARYKQYHNQKLEVQWIDGKVECLVIPDDAVDPEFGTGVMTITPAHDALDFEIRNRHPHEIKVEQIIDFDGRLNTITGKFAGLSIKDARKAIIQQLTEKNLVVKVDQTYTHNVAVNYRGKGVIEPQIMRQWFIDVNKKVIDWKGEKRSIKEVLRDCIDSEMITIVPKRFDKTYFHWIDNLKDWCISRQIWWGHRIPIWYQLTAEQYKAYEDTPNQSSYLLDVLGVSHNGVFSLTKPTTGDNWIQDPDTLDTWFSASLWTFATLGWPQKSADLDAFHPTDVLETGYDILFFWVARMILSSTYVLRREGYEESKCIPFKTVYLHGLIRDRDGKKMSKSRPETCIDPLDMIDKYGTDAVRLSLIIGNTPGNDMNLYEEKIGGYRNFVNKIWNSSRYVLMKVRDINAKIDLTALNDADRWILNELDMLIAQVEKDIDNLQLSNAGSAIYDCLWKVFCDFYLEMNKIHANDGVVMHGLLTFLKLLHPFTPFVTEAIYQNLRDAGYKSENEMLIMEKWPTPSNVEIQPSVHKNIYHVINVIKSIRQLKIDNKVDPAKKLDCQLYSPEFSTILTEMSELVRMMANVSSITILTAPVETSGLTSLVEGTYIYLASDVVIDPALELKKLAKEKELCQKLIETVSAKLSSSEFTSKAPEKVIEFERSRLQKAEMKLEELKLLEQKLQ